MRRALLAILLVAGVLVLVWLAAGAPAFWRDEPLRWKPQKGPLFRVPPEVGPR